VSYTEGGDPSYEAGVAAGGRSSTARSARAPPSGTARRRLDRSHRPVTLEPQKNANYDETTLMRLARSGRPATRSVTPSFYYQDRYRNDVESYWPLYSNPGSDIT
jgi:hypothetical protein